MKLKQLRYAILFLFFFASLAKLNAQDIKAEEKPAWIKMIDDPAVNYFTAVKTFNDFWRNKEKPVEEDEIFESNAKKIKKREPKEEDARKYAFEYKKFLNWQRSVLPFVQPDGRILSKEERLKIFEGEKNLRAKSGS